MVNASNERNRNRSAGPTDGMPQQSGVAYFARFGVDERMINDALCAALGRGADHADLFFQHRISRSIVLRDGVLERVRANVELGVAVRLSSGREMGHAWTEELSREAILRAARTAAAIAKGPATRAPRSFSVSSACRRRQPPPGERWERVGLAPILALLRSVAEKTFARDACIRSVTCRLNEQHGAILIADSAGRLAFDDLPSTSLRLWCVAERNGVREQNYGAIAGRAGIMIFTPERLAALVDDTVRRTLVLHEASLAPSGEMPIVMAAGASGLLLHEAIGHGMEADFNMTGVSPYADKVGQRVARSIVTIVDDGAIDGAYGSLNVDDEGNAPTRTLLVDRGRLATYLHDATTAAHYGVKATGNGRRESFRFPPLPRMRSTYMLGGPHDREEVIRSVARGLYCETFTSGETRVGGGDFTFFVKNAHLIEGGVLTRPVRDVCVVGNGPELLRRIDMVADDLELYGGASSCVKAGQTVPVSLGLPTVRVPRVNVTRGMA